MKQKIIDMILPNDLQQIIVDTIKQQCYRYKQLELQERALYYEPYTKRRKKHSVTTAVLSGFAPDRFAKDGIEVTDLNYGLSTNYLIQPELVTNTAVIQLYSNGAKPLKNTIVQERCRQYNGVTKENRRFLIIQFWTDTKGNLNKIEAQYPNDKGNVLETKLLYQKPNLAFYKETG